MSCPNYVNDLFMADSLKGWIATDDGIYFTDDGFQTFQLQYNKPIAGFSFNDKSHGYAFGYNILLSTDQTGLINDVSSLHSNNIENLNIFPNPCNAKTELILDGSLTKVILSDLNGKILYCISTTDKRVTINTESLIPGIYLISAKNDRATFNKKLVVAR
jgi:hypothetical protein